MANRYIYLTSRVPLRSHCKSWQKIERPGKQPRLVMVRFIPRVRNAISSHKGTKRVSLSRCQQTAQLIHREITCLEENDREGMIVHCETFISAPEIPDARVR